MDEVTIVFLFYFLISTVILFVLGMCDGLGMDVDEIVVSVLFLFWGIVIPFMLLFYVLNNFYILSVWIGVKARKYVKK